MIRVFKDYMNTWKANRLQAKVHVTDKNECSQLIKKKKYLQSQETIHNHQAVPADAHGANASEERERVDTQ